MDTAEDIRTLFEERFEWAGASTSETRALKKLLAKCTTAEIYEAIRRHAGIDSIRDAEDAEAVLYSFTELQVIEFVSTLSLINGWD